MKHTTDWKKTLADPADYASNWDWTVAHSEYHFDNSVTESVGDWFDIFCSHSPALATDFICRP